MVKYVIKRNGEQEEFNIDKIKKVLIKIAEGIDIDKLINQIKYYLSRQKEEVLHVDDIETIVEKVLIKNNYYSLARDFIIYRKQKQNMLNFSQNLVKLVNTYVKKEDWQVKENSNMSFSLQGLNNYITNAVIQQYWLDEIYPKFIAHAHINGDIHIHDLGILGAYCCGWDLKDLLLNGFTGVEGKVSSNPPRHFRTALGQVVNYFYTLQGETAGAQAFSNFDTYLAPFIYYDGLTYKEVKQCIQEFLFNMNVPTRVGFQPPFTNITLDIVPSSPLKEQPVIIGGKLMDKTYGEFQEEMNMFNMAFCEVMMEGDSKGRPFSFPIPTYNITKDWDWNSPVVDKIMQMTIKYGSPYFANFINSSMSPQDVFSMCCRLRLDKTELLKRGGGLFGANPLTGSLGVVTINLPRIGYLSKTEEEYFERLSDILETAKLSLEIKRKVIERMTEEGLYPYSKFYLRDVKMRFGGYWHNHFNTIGVIGMHESLMNFKGIGIHTKEGQEFALRVLEFIREKLIAFQEKTGLLFNLEATPAEGTSYRLARIDKMKYPDIYTSGINEPFYTNSTQLPVDYTDDLFTALDLQNDLQTKYTGGTVFHIFLGEKITDTDTAKLLLQKIMYNYAIPYISLTPTFSICQDHGYISGEHFSCPVCGKECEVYSRIVGYYRPVQNWNKGKQEEFRLRKEYKV